MRGECEIGQDDVPKVEGTWVLAEQILTQREMKAENLRERPSVHRIISATVRTFTK